MSALAAVLALMWAALVLTSAWVFRPRPVRVPGTPGPRGRPSFAVSLRVGRWVRARLNRLPDAAADTRVGRVIMSVVCVGPIDLRLGIAAAVAAGVAPILSERRSGQRQRLLVLRELPEVIDLLRLSLAGGGSVSFAVRGVAAVPFGPVTRALSDVMLRVERGHRFADALGEMQAQVGDEVRPLVRALIGAEHYGTELLPTLEQLGAEARDRRRRAVQAAARRVPIRLLLPLVLCILPAFVLLTLVPTLAGTLDGLQL